MFFGSFKKSHARRVYPAPATHAEHDDENRASGAYWKTPADEKLSALYANQRIPRSALRSINLSGGSSRDSISRTEIDALRQFTPSPDYGSPASGTAPEPDFNIEDAPLAPSTYSYNTKRVSPSPQELEAKFLGPLPRTHQKSNTFSRQQKNMKYPYPPQQPRNWQTDTRPKYPKSKSYEKSTPHIPDHSGYSVTKPPHNFNPPWKHSYTRKKPLSRKHSSISPQSKNKGTFSDPSNTEDRLKTFLETSADTLGPWSLLDFTNMNDRWDFVQNIDKVAHGTTCKFGPQDDSMIIRIYMHLADEFTQEALKNISDEAEEKTKQITAANSVLELLQLAETQVVNESTTLPEFKLIVLVKSAPPLLVHLWVKEMLQHIAELPVLRTYEQHLSIVRWFSEHSLIFQFIPTDSLHSMVVHSGCLNELYGSKSFLEGKVDKSFSRWLSSWQRLVLFQSNGFFSAMKTC